MSNVEVFRMGSVGTSILEDLDPYPADGALTPTTPSTAKSQIAHSYESETFIRYRECLTDIGIEPGNDADTVLAQVKDSGLDVPKCFEEGTSEE
ncbi:hypothetical protein [uncultured Microbacterium sp.]|uniref:hypothetical protein n=1 Tax=uncultured Microbacterium sp. TaxID=191216 RepID=UPI002605BB67|nr:hypothetical protein [uncultured Microbacterium sp.]